MIEAVVKGIETYAIVNFNGVVLLTKLTPTSFIVFVLTIIQFIGMSTDWILQERF